MYPYVAVLIGSINAVALQSDTCQDAALRCQRLILNNTPPAEAYKVFRTWDLYSHLDALQRTSAKFLEVKRLVMQMITDSNPETAPEDNSGIRHAIIFHNQSISAVLTYVLIMRDPDLRGVVKPLLLSSALSNEERAKVIKDMNVDCTPGSPNKLLIAVSTIAAEGFNIQRANNIWFTELPATLSKKRQAVGRAYRQGQKMKVNIVKLIENGNLMEELGYDSISAKETVSRLVYGLEPLS